MHKANLMLHTGAQTVTREQVEAVNTPARTESWVPVPHGKMLTLVRDAIEATGLHVVGESHGLGHEGQRYFGLMQVANGDNPRDFGLVIGLRNSHDKSFPAGLVLGASVFVCDNLSFSGQVKLARKHTSRIEADLPQLITRGVGLLADLRGQQTARFDAYKLHELTHVQAHDLMIQAVDSQVVPLSGIRDVLAQWRHPNHEEFSKHGLTAWRLFNAFTEALKGNLGLLPRRTQALHGLLDAVCGVIDRPEPRVIEDAEVRDAA